VSQTKKSKAEVRNLQRAWFVAGRIFAFQCAKCGSMGPDLAEKCNAPLDVECPGFRAMEAANKEFDDNFSRLVGADQR
jgi:hypothetical protein